MDFSVLNRGEKIAGVAGILLILIMFIFDWFGLKFTASGAFGISAEGGRNAWGSYGFIDIVLFITHWPRSALAVTAASDAEVGLPVAMSAIVAALGILSLVFVIISVISPPDFGVNVSGHGRRPRAEDRRLARAARRDRRDGRRVLGDAGRGDVVRG